MRLGYGVSGPLGERWFSSAQTRSLVKQAYDGGVRHFDTAPFYGAGEAEARLGVALADIGADDIVVSSKTGTRKNGRRVEKNFSAAAIREDVEASLTRLGRDRIDLLYLHGPTSAQTDLALPTLAALKQEGKIGAFGVCGEDEALAHAVNCKFGAIMGAYNVMDRRHEKIFAAAQAAGVLTVAIAPLAQAIYDRNFFRPASLADIWRIGRAAVRYGRGGIAHMRTVRATLEGVEGWTPAQAALGFVLANQAVDVAMTTSANPTHLAQSILAAGRTLTSAQYAALSRLSLDPASSSP